MAPDEAIAAAQAATERALALRKNNGNYMMACFGVLVEIQQTLSALVQLEAAEVKRFQALHAQREQTAESTD